MIKIKNLNKHFKDRIIFENLNLELPNIGLVAILGDSGSGKTTLLNCLYYMLTCNFEKLKDNAFRKKIVDLQIEDTKIDIINTLNNTLITKYGINYQDYDKTLLSTKVGIIELDKINSYINNKSLKYLREYSVSEQNYFHSTNIYWVPIIC